MNRTLRGILRTILLDVIDKKGPLYGLEIVREVESVSEGTGNGKKIVLNAGSLYPALHTFERQGLVKVETRPAPRGGGTVNYYELTPKGKRELAKQREEVETLFVFGRAMLGLKGLLRL